MLQIIKGHQFTHYQLIIYWQVTQENDVFAIKCHTTTYCGGYSGVKIQVTALGYVQDNETVVSHLNKGDYELIFFKTIRNIQQQLQKGS